MEKAVKSSQWSKFGANFICDDKAEILTNSGVNAKNADNVCPNVRFQNLILLKLFLVTVVYS